MAREFNFDVIFTGDPEVDQRNASHFCHGLKELIGRARAEYANTVLYDRSEASVHLRQAQEYETAWRKFLDDPRMEKIRRWQDEKEQRELGQKLGSALAEIFTHKQ